MDIIVDPEFERLIPPLSEQELRQLECSLLDDGALSPLAVWTPHNILLDGHHRLRLFRLHDIPFTTTSLEFESRDAARLWIIGHQLGRRNLPPEQAAYYRGQQYGEQRSDPVENLQKPQCFSKGHCDPSGDSQEATEAPDATADRLAKEHRVSPSTIKRDAQFAEALDALAELFGAEFRSDVLAGTSGLAKKDIVTLAQMPRERLEALSQDRGNLREVAELWRKRKQDPAPSTTEATPAPVADEGPPASMANEARDYHDALVNILRVFGQKEESLEGLRGQLERIEAIVREALGEMAEDREPEDVSEAPLITDEDLL